MSTNSSSSDNDKNKQALRPSTREREAQGPVVRPWALAVDASQKPEIAMTDAQLKELATRLGRDVDV